MDPPVVDALLDVLGPFVFPAVLFAAGAVGYGLLLSVRRLLASGGRTEWKTETNRWRTETSEVSDDATDADRHKG